MENFSWCDLDSREDMIFTIGGNPLLPPLEEKPAIQINPSRTLIIQNLPLSFRDRHLRKIFAKIGPLEKKSCKVLRHPPEADSKALSKGYGYVKFVNFKDARKAVREIHGQIHFGKVLQVSLMRPEAKQERNVIFVNFIPENWDKNDVLWHFAKSGQVVQIHMLESRGCAFVKFSSDMEAENAIDWLPYYKIGAADEKLMSGVICTPELINWIYSTHPKLLGYPTTNYFQTQESQSYPRLSPWRDESVDHVHIQYPTDPQTDGRLQKYIPNVQQNLPPMSFVGQNPVAMVKFEIPFGAHHDMTGLSYKTVRQNQPVWCFNLNYMM